MEAKSYTKEILQYIAINNAKIKELCGFIEPLIEKHGILYDSYVYAKEGKLTSKRYNKFKEAKIIDDMSELNLLVRENYYLYIKYISGYMMFIEITSTKSAYDAILRRALVFDEYNDKSVSKVSYLKMKTIEEWNKQVDPEYPRGIREDGKYYDALCFDVEYAIMECILNKALKVTPKEFNSLLEILKEKRDRIKWISVDEYKKMKIKEMKLSRKEMLLFEEKLKEYIESLRIKELLEQSEGEKGK